LSSWSFGRSDFDRLQARARTRTRKPGADPVAFCAFDLLVHDGVDIMALPWEQRQKRLKSLLWRHPPPAVLYVSGVDDGFWLYEQALALQLEGVVAKRRNSPYRPGERTFDWLKVKRPGAVPAQRFKRKA
jgi:bifunctional non-homologous end joining protein LigD